MQATAIEWTDFSVNPIRAKRKDDGQRVPGHYCEKISAGCANCYASELQRRFGMPGFGGVKTAEQREAGNVVPFLDENVLRTMLRSRKISGKKVFIGDMTDIFGAWVPDEWLDRLFAVFALRPDVTWQVLTKRTGRMREYLLTKNSPLDESRRDIVMEVAAHLGKIVWDIRGSDPRNYYNIAGGIRGRDFSNRRVPAAWPLPNVWLGCSVENQSEADERIPELLRTPAAVRFLSVEPLVGAFDLTGLKTALGGVRDDCLQGVAIGHDGIYCALDGSIDWVIVGGESGRKARPMHPDWVRSLRDQCQAAGVPFFFKQWGNYGADCIDMTNFDPVFRMFETKIQWINKASSWVMGGTCIDRAGKVLRVGADFDAAAYPVAIMHKMPKKQAGRVLDGRTWDEMPVVAEVLA